MTIRIAIVVLGLWVGIQGCGYQTFHTAQAPARWIMIPVFQNETFEPAMESILTHRVKQVFIRRGGFRITQDPAQAQLILEGRVTQFDLTPVSLDRRLQAAEYRLSITVQVRVLSAPDHSLLLSLGTIRGHAEYGVLADPAVTRSAEDLAIVEAAQNIGEEIWIRTSRLGLTIP